MAAVLALGSALVYGAADFLGGFATRRSPTLAVAAVSQLIGLLVLLAVLPFLPGEPIAADLRWGALAGVMGGGGIALFYRSLARGTMSVVAPVTATTSAAVPFLVGLALGERPSALALAGIGLALVAIGLISGAAAPFPVPQPASWWRRWRPRSLHGIGGAVGAGLAFGLFFVLIQRADPAAGLWPLVGARGGSFGLFVVAAIAGRRSLRPVARDLRIIAGAGALDMAANVLFLLAVQRGLLSIVAVLTALYPASTVVLAHLVLGERLARPQRIGLACAALGAALIVVG